MAKAAVYVAAPPAWHLSRLRCETFLVAYGAGREGGVHAGN